MAPDKPPLFATYLLPSFIYPSRRRQSSTSSATARRSSNTSVPSLSSSPTSSILTTPSSSPPSTNFALPTRSARGLLQAALQSLHSASPNKPQAPRLAIVQPNTLKCLTCSTDIAFADQIVSKGFTGRHGRAYLVGPPPLSKNAAVDVGVTEREKKKHKEKLGQLINTKAGRLVNRELLTGHHTVSDVSCVICGTVLGWKYVDAKEEGQKYKIGKYILEMQRVGVIACWEDTVEVVQNFAIKDVVGKEEEDGEGVVLFDSEDEDECEELFAGTWDPEVVAKRRGRKVVARKPVDDDKV